MSEYCIDCNHYKSINGSPRCTHESCKEIASGNPMPVRAARIGYCNKDGWPKFFERANARVS